jgi:peptidoglycan/LPS O-acetylase OafA/YrhL
MRPTASVIIHLAIPIYNSLREKVKPERPAYIQGIDGLRAISILAVLSFHGSSILQPIFGKSGWLGVDVFFVISGFLITRILLIELKKTQRINLISFYRNRFFRITPAFLVLLSVYAIINPSESMKTNQALVISVLNLADYDIALNWGHVIETGLSFCWSLSIEEKFYFFFPIILLIQMPFATKIIALIVTCLIWKMYLITNGAEWLRIAASFDTRFDELLIGSLFAYYSIDPTSLTLKLTKNQIVTPLALILLFTSFHLVPHPSTIPSTTTQIILWCGILPLITLISGILLISFTLKTDRDFIRYLLHTPPLIFVGKISYSLYLWHGLIFLLGGVSQKQIPHQVMLLTTSLIISWGSYILFEKGFQRFKSKHGQPG